MMSQGDGDRREAEKRQFTATVVEQLLARLEFAASASERDSGAGDVVAARSGGQVSPVRRVRDRLVTRDDVMEVVYAGRGERSLLVSPDAVVTPDAREAAARYGVAIVFSELDTEGDTK